VYWELTAREGMLFPVLDADLTPTPAADQTTVFALTGVFRSPPDLADAGLDHEIVYWFATAASRGLGLAGPMAGPSAGAAGPGGKDGQVMFVAQDLTIGTGSRAAQARFENLLHGSWLAEMSQATCDGGVVSLLKVGPAGPVAAKLVRVRFLGPVYRGDVMTVGLRWEAAGAAGTAFPMLDANIVISPAGDETARLALAGSYRPPLGRLGAGLDRAIMHRVATATMRCLLRSVAEALVSSAPVGRSAKDASPGWQPAPEPGMP